MPRRSILPVLLTCFAGLCLAGQPLDGLPDTVDKVRKCVGAVGTYNRANHPPMEFSASGFFIDSKGYFLTANHAIEAIAKRRRLSDLRVFLPGDKERVGHPATVVTQDERFDLALLKVEGPAFDALAVADSTEAREGQSVALCGFPFGFLLGLHPSTSAGIISSISPIAIPVVNTRQLDPAMVEALRSPFDVFQLDVTAYPGHSGAPLFEPSTGRVLGVVNSAFIRRTKEKVFSSGISYAIPIHLARKLLDDARRQKTATEE